MKFMDILLPSRLRISSHGSSIRVVRRPEQGSQDEQDPQCPVLGQQESPEPARGQAEGCKYSTGPSGPPFIMMKLSNPFTDVDELGQCSRVLLIFF